MITLRPRRGGAGLGIVIVACILVVGITFAFIGGPMLVTVSNTFYNGVDVALGTGAGQESSGSNNSSIIYYLNGSSPSLLYFNAPKPSDYITLVNYMLQLINNDRYDNGVYSNISLDFNPAAQQHAYSMLINNYFSHWDTQGYKPYMRYTIAGGSGAVEENVAYAEGPGQFMTQTAIEKALYQLEYEMVYQDAAHGWLHRYNILDPYHNYVSIGIAYNANVLYLVQDFENKYINWTQPIAVSQSWQVTMVGQSIYSGKIQDVEIFYDPPVSQLTPAQLAQPPYDGSYTQGTFIAGVVSSGYQIINGNTLTATIWDVNSQGFTISFNIKELIDTYGAGEYTLYISIGASSSGSAIYLTSLTIFVP